MKKNLLIILTLALISCQKEKQESCLQLDLKYGKYEVGFMSYNNYDSTRYFPDSVNKTYRPVQTSVWYPAIKSSDEEYMEFQDYIYLRELETKYVELNKHMIDSSISQYLASNASFDFGIPEKSGRIELSKKTKALKNAELIKEKFPVIIYATGSNGNSFENSVICEFLASHGFVVLSSPNIGYNSRWIEHYRESFKEIDTHAKDIEYLISFSGTLPNTKYDKIGLIGFSFGGTSSLLSACRDDRVTSLVSFDGSFRFNYPIHVKQSDYFNPDSLRIPFLYLSEKPYPIDTLKKYGVPDTEFNYFKGIKNINAFYFELPETMHENFSSWFIKMSRRMPEHGESSIENINKGHEAICNYTKNFFNWTLKNEKEGLKYLEHNPTKNGYDQNIIKLLKRIEK